MAGEKYSKSDLINALAGMDELSSLTKKEVKLVVDALFGKMTDIVVNQGVVTIQGFGRVFTRTAKAKAFKKITSGEIVQVGERSLPKIKFSKALVNRVKDQ